MMKLVESRETFNNRINPRVELIKQLIPLGLEAVKDMLEQEVNSLVGTRYERDTGELTRWGKNPGSVNMGGQKVRIEVPRVRNKLNGQEVQLESYRELKDKSDFDEQVFNTVINGISTRKYQKVASSVPEVFGISKNRVSQGFKAASAKRLKEFFERDLSQEDIVAIFIDGKPLRGTQIVIALGVTINGNKIPLGFIETSTENKRVCKDFLNELLDRGLNTENEILFIIDGAKGIYAAVKEIFEDKAFIQRCQWHKRENVISYLPKNLQDTFRAKLQAAYNLPEYDQAKAKLLDIKKELSLINESAARSLEEGLEETLTLHKLGLFKTVGKSFKTTNPIENLNKQISSYTKRVCKWKNSDQRRRWVASALVEMQAGFKTVEGHKDLPKLRERMKTFTNKLNTENKLAA